MFSKTSLISFALLLSQASGFGGPLQYRPVSSSSSRLYYVNDPSALTAQDLISIKKRGRYELHSNNVKCLTASSSTDDVIKAIKRASNTKSVHDIQTLGAFLLEGTDETFGYGFKGDLLARFAVAALRVDEYDLAQRAIEARRADFPATMVPFESAAILRGLLRCHRVEEAFDFLDDELSVEENHGIYNADRLKHRAQALASIASRHFFEAQPQVAIRACKMLQTLGPLVADARLSADFVEMPWHRLLVAADECKVSKPDGDYDELIKAIRSFPLDDDFVAVFDRLAEK
jgi:hypothetical protein